ncbi:hypothetical protein Nepgr_007970 [Nepenthes gracilis]|uniref:Uncharacterized protein n=1 Tax=Nepenthes gracilis TaxID=150966 RepID=A0AAD3S827_NEPGR|nr:hypothetical protein Nepgr_007970 [Nepenthes gracilis]
MWCCVLKQRNNFGVDSRLGWMQFDYFVTWSLGSIMPVIEMEVLCDPAAALDLLRRLLVVHSALLLGPILLKTVVAWKASDVGALDCSDAMLNCLLLMLVPAEIADVFSYMLDILYPTCLGCMDGGRQSDDVAG